MQKRAYHKHTPHSTREKTFLTSEELESFLRKAMRGHLDRHVAIELADEKYYVPPRADVEEIVKNWMAEGYEYRPEVFDCDDFAEGCHWAFTLAAYADDTKRDPFAVAELWCMFADRAEDHSAGGHAINLILIEGSEGPELWFIEPQTGDLFQLDARIRQAWSVRF